MLGWFAQHHPDGVKLLIDYHAEVNSRAYDGATPLHRAAARGALEIVKLLVDTGADASIIENDGSTALVQAASRGYLDVVQQLTRRGGNYSAAESYRPVQLQCEPGMPGPSDVVNQIIRTCSHLKNQDQLRGSEIWQAAQQGYWAVVSKLQEAGVDPYRKNEYGYRALIRLVYKEDLRRVNELIESKVQSSVPDDDLALSLTRAAAAGHREILAHLLSITEPDFYENAIGSKALVAAARYGHVELVKLLLLYVPQHCWYRALVRGAENGHLDVVNIFLSQGIHPTRQGARGDTAIVRAARYGHLNVVKRLLEAGADPNQHGWFGYSALVRASYNDFLAVVDCLLNAGASPDLPEIDGDTAMIRSVRLGHSGIVERLRQAGARPVDDVHEKMDGPSKALMKAAIYNNEDTLLRLLQEGADPNTIEADGNTPLSRACENGHLSIVSSLLRSGARAYNPSQKFISPLERAAEEGYLEIVKMLINSNSKIPLAEKRRAMLKSSERGHVDITASLIEDGVDLHNQPTKSSAVGLVHFSILNHWMKSVVADVKYSALKTQISIDKNKGLHYSQGPPTWGFDGTLVARFRSPFKVTFSSDLTSSNLRYLWSSALLKARYALKLMKRFSFWLGALLALVLGFGLLGMEYIVRVSLFKLYN